MVNLEDHGSCIFSSRCECVTYDFICNKLQQKVTTSSLLTCGRILFVSSGMGWMINLQVFSW